MKLNQVALQLYTVRKHTQTAADLAQTFKRAKQIGYNAVQISAIGDIPVEEVKKILDDEGVVCCATHEPGDTIRKTPEKVIERLQKLGCSNTAYPWPQGVDWSKREDILSLVSDLDKAGAVFQKAGITLSYHNHHVEFMRFEGTTLLDYIFSHTDPKNLQAELDTYWVQNGGGNPVEWCKKLKNRLSVMHIKDYTVLPTGELAFASIGGGNLDWPAIISAGDQSGCKWFIVEQDTTPGDPFDAIKESYDYIKAHLVSA